jgi:CBS domain-containing protein
MDPIKRKDEATMKVSYTMKVSHTMKKAVISTTPQTTVLEAAKLLIEKRIGTLPVVDSDHKLIGMITIDDVLDVFIPNYFGLIENLSFVHGFGALEDFQPKDFSEVDEVTVETLMKTPVFVEETDSIFRAATRLFRHELIDLPVVDSQGKLVGLASHVDVGTAFLQKWLELKEPR